MGLMSLWYLLYLDEEAVSRQALFLDLLNLMSFQNKFWSFLFFVSNYALMSSIMYVFSLLDLMQTAHEMASLLAQISEKNTELLKECQELKDALEKNQNKESLQLENSKTSGETPPQCPRSDDYSESMRFIVIIVIAVCMYICFYTEDTYLM